ncbi:hypothetical protein HZA33_03535 [Candidatus Pacearchaeota archaeon]|nr:hypothetical protein [Candidatus Pacearchaeota archaeon]
MTEKVNEQVYHKIEVDAIIASVIARDKRHREREEKKLEERLRRLDGFHDVIKTTIAERERKRQEAEDRAFEEKIRKEARIRAGESLYLQFKYGRGY